MLPRLGYIFCSGSLLYLFSFLKIRKEIAFFDYYVIAGVTFLLAEEFTVESQGVHHLF